MGLAELKRLTLVPLIVFTLSVLAWSIVDNQKEVLRETSSAQEVTASLEPLLGDSGGVQSQRQRPQFQHPGNASSVSLVSPRPTLVVVNAPAPDETTLSSSVGMGEATLGPSILTGTRSRMEPHSLPTVVGTSYASGPSIDLGTASDSNASDDEPSTLTVTDSVWVALREPPVLQDPRQMEPQVEQAKLPVFTPRTPVDTGERSFPRNLPRWIEQAMQDVESSETQVKTVDTQQLFLELQQYGAVPVVLSPEYEQQWQARLQEAHRLAARGSLDSAEQQVEALLFELASTLDGMHQCAVHQVLVSEGLRALREASDFYSQDVDRTDRDWVDAVADGHQTQLPKVQDTHRSTDVEVLQAYYDFGTQMLTWGCGHQAMAADAMFVLGRIHQASDTIAIHAAGEMNSTVVVPVEVIYHQIALGLNPQHSLAANELGVLRGRLGHWESAREALLLSLAAQPSVESWKNLAEVHHRLGERELSRLAANEARLIHANTQNAWPGSSPETRAPGAPSPIPTATARQRWNRAL